MKLPHSIVLLLACASGSQALDVSGTVLRIDGTGMPGVVVKLASSGAMSTTDQSGAWSISHGGSGIARPSLQTLPGSNFLLLENGRLVLKYRGFSPAGRRSTTDASRIAAGAPRVEEAMDTLTYSFGGNLFLRDTVSASRARIARTYDTTWNPSVIYGWVLDERDNQTYRAVKTGRQIWLAQNLNYRSTTGSSDTLGACYGFSIDSCAKYGRLYSLNQVMAGALLSPLVPSGVRGICPQSWHVPSDEEWQVLVRDVDTSSSTAAAHLKTPWGWKPYNGTILGGNDDFGFRALPAGTCVTLGPLCFGSSGDAGYWWTAGTSKLISADYAPYRAIDKSVSYVINSEEYPSVHLSLRCVKD